MKAILETRFVNLDDLMKGFKAKENTWDKDRPLEQRQIDASNGLVSLSMTYAEWDNLLAVVLEEQKRMVREDFDNRSKAEVAPVAEAANGHEQAAG